MFVWLLGVVGCQQRRLILPTSENSDLRQENPDIRIKSPDYYKHHGYQIAMDLLSMVLSDKLDFSFSCLSSSLWITYIILSVFPRSTWLRKLNNRDSFFETSISQIRIVGLPLNREKL